MVALVGIGFMPSFGGCSLLAVEGVRERRMAGAEWNFYIGRAMRAPMGYE